MSVAIEFSFPITFQEGPQNMTSTRWLRMVVNCALFAVSLAGTASAQDVGILRGGATCPAGSQTRYIYIDNEGWNNANDHSGWNGASHVTENTRLEFCQVPGWYFSQLDQPYMVLALDPAYCPPGSQRIIRRVDSDDFYPASFSDIDWVIPNPESGRDVDLHFCAFPPSGGAPLPYNPFPDLGISYGVFAPSTFSYTQPSGSGVIYMDDQDVEVNGYNNNQWCENTLYPVDCSYLGDSRNYWDIVYGGYNTHMSLALVRNPHDSLVPIMTSAATPSGSVTRSGVYSSSYEGWSTFDGTNALWLSNMNTSAVWVGYEWGGGVKKTVTSYQITYANGSCCEQRGPKNWKLQGWLPLIGWVTVSTVTNQTGWYSNPIRTFSVSSPGAFTKYRLYVTADNYNAASPITLVSIAELKLYGY